MADIYTPVIRALVVASLFLATATLMLVAVNTARAAGALAIGSCGAFGEAFDFQSIEQASQSALSKCQGESCRIVTTAKRGCAASPWISPIPVARTAGARARGSAAARTRHWKPATATAAKSA